MLSLTSHSVRKGVKTPVHFKTLFRVLIPSSFVDSSSDTFVKLPMSGARASEYWLLWTPPGVRVSTTVQVHDSHCSAPLSAWLSTT